MVAGAIMALTGWFWVDPHFILTHRCGHRFPRFEGSKGGCPHFDGRSPLRNWHPESSWCFEKVAWSSAGPWPSHLEFVFKLSVSERPFGRWWGNDKRPITTSERRSRDAPAPIWHPPRYASNWTVRVFWALPLREPSPSESCWQRLGSIDSQIGKSHNPKRHRLMRFLGGEGHAGRKAAFWSPTTVRMVHPSQ